MKTYFYVPKIKYEKIYINNELVYKVDGMCWSTPSPCLRNINREIIKNMGLEYILKNENEKSICNNTFIKTLSILINQ